jgi:predicted phosphohydrolase
MSRERADDLYPTASVDQDKLMSYLKMDPQSAPPIQYVEDETGSKLIVDGNHRWWAAQLRGETEVEAEEFPASEEFRNRFSSLFGGRGRR